MSPVLIVHCSKFVRATRAVTVEFSVRREAGMAGHQLKKLAQSRGKGIVRSSLIEAVPKHWSVYTLVFSTVFLLLFCFLLFDIRTSPTALLVHATSQLGALRAQAGEMYSQSTGNSLADSIEDRNFRKGMQHRAEDSDSDEHVDDENERNQKRKPKSLNNWTEDSSDQFIQEIEKEGKDWSKAKVPTEDSLQVDHSNSDGSQEFSADPDEEEKPVSKGVKATEKETTQGRSAVLEDQVLEGQLRYEEVLEENSDESPSSEGATVSGSVELTGSSTEKKSSAKKADIEVLNTEKVSESKKETPKREEKKTKKESKRKPGRSSKKTPPQTSGQETLKEVISDGKCDYSTGQWVYDESYPLYKPDTCPFVDGGFRCVENGRPSAEFQKYRWQPSGCNLPRFDPKNMLEKLRGRRLAFVGDSIGRNNWESMLCMLAGAVPDKSRIYEINGESISKHKGFLSFKFVDYNCTVEYYRSPYLVPQGRAPPNSPPQVRSTFKLDQIDWSSVQWRDADVLIFNSGHWWSYEKTLRGGNYFQVKDKVKMDMEVGDAFRMAIQTVGRYVEEYVDPQKTQVFWRSYAPVHFRGGTWKTGGSCINEERPLSNLSNYQDPWASQMIWEVTQKNKRTPMIFLNVTFASEHRADGHSSVYQRVPPSPVNRQDCSHWCLPGVPDTWNEFLYAALLDRGQGPWGEKTE